MLQPIHALSLLFGDTLFNTKSFSSAESISARYAPSNSQAPCASSHASCCPGMIKQEAPARFQPSGHPASGDAVACTGQLILHLLHEAPSGRITPQGQFVGIGGHVVTGGSGVGLGVVVGGFVVGGLVGLAVVVGGLVGLAVVGGDVGLAVVGGLVGGLVVVGFAVVVGGLVGFAVVVGGDVGLAVVGGTVGFAVVVGGDVGFAVVGFAVVVVGFCVVGGAVGAFVVVVVGFAVVGAEAGSTLIKPATGAYPVSMLHSLFPLLIKNVPLLPQLVPYLNKKMIILLPMS